MENIVTPSGQSRSPLKLTFLLLLDQHQHQVLVVGLNLSLSFYSVYWNNYNPANNQMCNHLLDLL